MARMSGEGIATCSRCRKVTPAMGTGNKRLVHSRPWHTPESPTPSDHGRGPPGCHFLAWVSKWSRSRDRWR